MKLILIIIQPPRASTLLSLHDALPILLAADGSELDAVRSYAGLRSTSLRDHEFRINGEKVFQRLVLDQGYWEETFLTSAWDAAIATDLRLAPEAGLDGRRPHHTGFEARLVL